jgi:hypothetical protein
LTKLRGKPLFWISGGLFLLLFLSIAPLRQRLFPAILTDGSRQQRQNVALHIPRSSFSLNQTFVAAQDGLSEVTILLARYDAPGVEENARLTLSLYTADNQLLRSQTYRTRDLQHNQQLTLTLPPQPNSNGQAYRLQISGSKDNPVTVWGYDFDSYHDGAFTLQPRQLDAALPEPRAADIWFVTRSRLTWGDAGYALLSVSWYQGYLLPIIGFVLLLPGALLLRVPALSRLLRDPLARWGTAVAVGTAVWPLVWQFSSLLGLRWTTPTLLITLGAGWLLWLLLLFRQRGQARRVRWRPLHALFLLMLIAALALRLLAVREFNAPLWVDGSRHALITAVISSSGQMITNYAPYLPVNRFPYHDGFHTIAAMIRLLSGAPVNELLLYLGQLLNALIPLTVYAGLWICTRRRHAALAAAFFVAFPLFFPAYYASWGRLTQLTAVFVLPLLLAFTWKVSSGARTWRRLWWIVVLLLSGLFLIHARVFAYFLPFLPLAWLAASGKRRKALLLSSGGTLLLISPRLLTLLRDNPRALQLSNVDGSSYFSFPIAYYEAGLDRYFIWLAGLGLILLLAALIERKPWSRLPLLVLLWVALQFLLTGGALFGYPIPAFLNLNSMYITLFLPLVFYLGALAAGAGRSLRYGPLWLRSSTVAGAGLLIAALTVVGAHQQITIINPVTVKAHPADLAAIAWLDAELPRDARVAVNGWRWLNETWAADDGGGWILPLSGRMTSTPPVDYTFDPELSAAVRAFNEAATAVDWSDPAAAQWLAEAGWTHLFVGVRGGFLDPAALNRNPRLQLIYDQDGVTIFAITKPVHQN